MRIECPGVTMSATFVRDLLDRLAVSPVRLRALLMSVSDATLRSTPHGGGFAPIEDAWHLRDIEAEGHFVRIRRILAEERPVLVSIDGEELARERRYLARELGTALDEFAQYREASVGLLGTLAEEAWLRSATFEDRTVSLRELVTAMVDHDESHLAALATLLAGGRYESVHVSEGGTAGGVSASR
jgi:DinB superfamily